MRGSRGRFGKKPQHSHSGTNRGYRRKHDAGTGQTKTARGSASRGMYRSRSGVVAGVCRGLAEYYGFNVFWMRVVVVAVFFMSGIWPVLFVYFLASLVMKPEPVRPIQTEDEQDFYDSYVHSRPSAARRLKRRYENLESRLQRMEDTVTGREFEWEQKMNG